MLCGYRRFLAFVCMVVAAPWVLSANAASPRVSRDLQVLYTWEQTTGDLVRDRSGVGQPLDLKIDKPSSVQRHQGRLVVRASTRIMSAAPARKIVDAVKRSNEITVEAWVQPASNQQDGPARIVSLSKDTSRRNLTLGQDGSRYDVRLRTTATSENGIPSLATSDNSAATRLTHVVYTRDGSGNATIYVDGKRRSTKKVAGNFSKWSDDYRLVLANEATGDRPWLGELHLVAAYSRALNESEVHQNFAAGADALVSPELLAERERLNAVRHFERQVAPLLARRCIECHDVVTKEGGLDLSHKSAALAGGESGKAIIAGNASQSPLWSLVESDEMPQDRKPLSPEEKSILRKWIEGGAVWSFDFIDPVIYRNERQAVTNWVRRLTLPEYIETVRSAVGVDIADEAREILPADVRADGFSNTAYNLGVDLRHVQAYARLAEVIVGRMDIEGFAAKFTSNKQLTDENMRRLIERMGTWLLRGPLDEYEITSLRGVSTTVAAAGGNFDAAVRSIVEAMLQSPRFIYRIEKQQGHAGSWPIGPYELASRMSYFIWGGPPDEELMRAANDGKLGNRTEIAAQARRMLQNPRAVDRSLQFVDQWLNLGRLKNLKPNPNRFPEFDPALASDMRQETLEFFKHVVWQQQRPLADLLNAQVTFATPRLAKHYGLLARDPDEQAGDRSGGSAPVRYGLSQVPSRGGLLTQGSVLTMGGDEASMVTRGLFVLQHVLFSEVGSPPPGLDTTPVPSSPGRSQRAIAEMRIADKSCGGCHAKFEPLAFGLERFDGLGTYREIDRYGNKMREDGKIHFPGDQSPVAYETSAQLMDLLAGSDRVQKCLTRKVIQFALGRPLVAADARIVDKIHGQAQQGGGTYAELATAIILSDLIQTTRQQQD